MAQKEYSSLAEFYPFYLKEHSRPLNRLLHVIGTTCGLFLLLTLLVNERYLWLPIVLIPGYAFAWFGHFFVEKNKPATFRYPLYSFVCDFIMFYELLCGKRSFYEYDQK